MRIGSSFSYICFTLALLGLSSSSVHLDNFCLQRFLQEWCNICPTSRRASDVSKAQYLLCGRPLPRAACQRNCKEEGTVHGMLGSTGSCQLMLLMPMSCWFGGLLGPPGSPSRGPATHPRLGPRAPKTWTCAISNTNNHCIAYCTRPRFTGPGATVPCSSHGPGSCPAHACVRALVGIRHEGPRPAMDKKKANERF